MLNTVNGAVALSGKLELCVRVEAEAGSRENDRRLRRVRIGSTSEQYQAVIMIPIIAACLQWKCTCMSSRLFA